MECKRCNKKPLITIQAHSKDLNIVTIDGNEVSEGYAPGNEIGLDTNSGGDDVIFTYCSQCGQIQNDFPIDVEDYLKGFSE